MKSTSRVCASCCGMLAATLYAKRILFSDNHDTITHEHFREKTINSFLRWHVINLSGHTISFSHPWLQKSSIFQSCHTAAMFSFTSFTQQNHHHSPRDRIRRAMFRNCQDVTDSELRQEVQTPRARRGYISLGSTIVNRTGTNGSTQVPQKTWKIMYLTDSSKSWKMFLHPKDMNIYRILPSTPCLGGKMPDSTATSNAVRCLASCSSISAPWRTSSSATSLAP